MTEQEWLAQSDKKKNEWIYNNIIGQDIGDNYIGVLNWIGFGLIVEKMGRWALHVRHENMLYIMVKFSDCGEYKFKVQAPTPWEAAALAYGKLKGLIK